MSSRETWQHSLLDENGVRLDFLAAAPGLDIGQAAIPVRIISSLAIGGGGGGGGIVAQGPKDITAQDWGVSVNNTVAVSGPLTDAQLRASPIGVSGPVTDAQLRATAVPVADGGGSLTVDGPLTDAQLRASLVPVSGPLTDAQLRAAVVPVGDGGGSLTVDGTFWQATQPVSGTFWQATQPVSGPLTDAQLRATPVVVDTKRGGAGSWTWVSVQSAAPAIGAVQADTGALAAGDYELHVHLSSSDTVAVGKGLIIEHRNAANAATLNRLGGIGAADSQDIDIPRITLAVNERIRVIAGTAAGAASSFYISAIGRRLL